MPPGLSTRVLAGLAPARAARPRRRSWAWLVAAGVVLAAGLWSWRHRAAIPPAAPAAPDVVETEDLEGDDELLAYAFERWEELHDEDLDLWLASLDPLDELTLEYTGLDSADDLPQAQNAGGAGGF